MEERSTLVMPEYSLTRKSILFNLWDMLEAHTAHYDYKRIRKVINPNARIELIKEVVKLYLRMRPKILSQLAKEAKKDKAGLYKPHDDAVPFGHIERIVSGDQKEEITEEDLNSVVLALINFIEFLGITKVESDKSDMNKILLDY